MWCLVRGSATPVSWLLLRPAIDCSEPNTFFFDSSFYLFIYLAIPFCNPHKKDCFQFVPHSIYIPFCTVFCAAASLRLASATKGISDTVAVAVFVGVVRSVAHSEATALEIKWSGP